MSSIKQKKSNNGSDAIEELLLKPNLRLGIPKAKTLYGPSQRILSQLISDLKFPKNSGRVLSLQMPNTQKEAWALLESSWLAKLSECCPAIFIDKEFALELDANKIITMYGLLEIVPKLYNDRYIMVLDTVKKKRNCNC